MDKLAILTLLILAVHPLHAQVYRCQMADKTLYQATPCPEKTVSQRALVIEKTPPNEISKAQRRLETWKTDFATREATEQAAEKERQQELHKKAELKALQRSAKAQEELAESARQPIIVNPQPVIINPPFPFRRLPHPPHHHGEPPGRNSHPDKPNSQQPLSTITNRH